MLFWSAILPCHHQEVDWIPSLYLLESWKALWMLWPIQCGKSDSVPAPSIALKWPNNFCLLLLAGLHARSSGTAKRQDAEERWAARHRVKRPSLISSPVEISHDSSPNCFPTANSWETPSENHPVNYQVMKNSDQLLI